MAWVQLDDDFFGNPKVMRAGRDARDLYLAALCFCNRGLTDGFVPVEALRRLAADADVDDPRALAARLEEVGLWEQAPGGWVVHQYLAHQRSKAQVTADKAANAKRQAAWRARKAGAVTPAATDGEGNDVTDISRNGVTNGYVTRIEEEEEPIDVPHAQVAGAGAQPTAGGEPSSAPRAVPRPPREDAPLPADWAPGADALAWAASKGWPPEWVADQTELFVGYWTTEAPRERKRNWYGAWQRWLNSEAQKRRPATGGARAPARPAAIDWADLDAVLGA